jgi:hypothetical protein
MGTPAGVRETDFSLPVSEPSLFFTSGMTPARLVQRRPLGCGRWVFMQAGGVRCA